MIDVRTAALAWADAGYAVLPAKIDGSKAPDVASWRAYQTELPTRDQVDAWYRGGRPGLGLLCGAISGGLELLELEGRAVDEGALKQLQELIDESGLSELWLRIAGPDGYAERSPSGGLHFLYRIDGGQVPGNTKLANRPARADELTDNERQILAKNAGRVFPRVLAETRGEGGFVVIAPSGGPTHPSGRPWELVHGVIGRVPTITLVEREQLHRLFRCLDQMPVREAAPTPTRPLTVVGDGVRPGDDFESKTPWDDELLLGGAGWKVAFTQGSTTYWRRPGKEDPGISATTGRDAARDRLYVFSSSTEFDTEVSITKFQAYSVLHHGGDSKAAARELRRSGFGEQRPAPIRSKSAAVPAAPGPAATPQPPVEGTAARELEQSPADEKLRIEIENDAKAIRDLGNVIDQGALPDIYVTNGELRLITQVSGDVSMAGLGPENRPPLPVIASTIEPDALARLFAEHTFLWEQKYTKLRGSFVEETVPTQRVFSSVLTRRHWPTVPELHGIVGSPVLRPDGTLLQDSGYDPATGLYLASKVDLPHVPARPSAEQVAEAKHFLIAKFLGDFPWVSEADRANYIGLLLAQILRPYLRTLTPFGLISATTQSSGKTILSEGIGLLYGQKIQPWNKNENELRKAITGLLDQPAATIVYDNVKEGSQIDSPTLAMLMTTPTWSDRILGTNRTFTAPNDRLWLATGNNLRLGGDMATRTVLVRLDPKMPRPELRDNDRFGIPHLDQWVKDPANRVELLWNLLVLVMDWIAAGAPRDKHTMRQFTIWASATGGLLSHHGIPGFLDNANEVRELDEEDNEWAVFLERWHDLFGSAHKVAREVRQSADVEWADAISTDRWDGRFLSDEEGVLPTAKGLGRYLRGQVGRFHGEYVLHAEHSRSLNCQVYWVEHHEGEQG
ncbi:bifunctional DNA primase/polymerase [Winogradskya humida]|uniref:DNA primase/polymerase bifunctional N-terminal domain-containing protein n=1 Tax=Winogradskya humida TaxID=113566 RepID=A0ABQ4A768_9ACTN|nr:bifunctional DNA primase/polymerase [Actinoplanes humidus]GIE26676.1 hypothetical protein Ahu01nite_097780 [Actinoplanes humidus]